MSLTYNFPQNRRVADVLLKLEKQQNKWNPEQFPMHDTYHQVLVGGSYVPSGNNGSYPINAEMDAMSVASYHPKTKYISQIGGVRSGGVRSGGQISGGRKSKFLKGLEDFGEYIKPVAKPILDVATKKAVEKLQGLGRKPKPTGGTKSKSARGALVSKLMREKGLSLGQASKYIKEHNM